MVCIHGKINDKSIHYVPNLYSLLYSKKNVLLCLPALPEKREAIPNNRSRNTYHTVEMFVLSFIVSEKNRKKDGRCISAST